METRKELNPVAFFGIIAAVLLSLGALGFYLLMPKNPTPSANSSVKPPAVVDRATAYSGGGSGQGYAERQRRSQGYGQQGYGQQGYGQRR